tara:strand:- start:15511 stop:15894 length:384 start_codon:yes stop_codon:yes gene_type:complete
MVEAWDHDASVNHPVSGAVWGDVLRKVAVWSYRVDVCAKRLERVCRQWKHYWAVAEGVFEIDARHDWFVMRIAKQLRMGRQRKREEYLVKLFRAGRLEEHPDHRSRLRAYVPVVTLGEFLARRETHL